MAASTTRQRRSDTDYAALLDKINTEFTQRLAQMAAEPKVWVEFLDQVAVFGARYGLGNQLLLMSQAQERGITPRYFLPGGNKAGTSGWKAHGRWIRRGETAFKIWAPLRRRPTEEQASEWEEAGRTVVREPSGRPAVQLVGFKLTNTFDISQTDGEPFEPPTVAVRRRVHTRPGAHAQLLTGDDPTGVYDDLLTLITDAGYTVELIAPRTGFLGDANGVTVSGPGTRLVQVRDDLDPAQRTKTTLHEAAHIRCGHLDNSTGAARVLHRGRLETEAESVTHIVLAALGLNTSAYSDAYVLEWADDDLDLVKDCAETILRVAKQILLDLTTEPEPADQRDSSDPDDTDAHDRAAGTRACQRHEPPLTGATIPVTAPASNEPEIAR